MSQFNYVQEMVIPMGREARANAARRERMAAYMFAPVLNVEGVPTYVNPQLIQYIEDAKNALDVETWGTAPDGNAWPICTLWFGPDHYLTVRGTAAMVLSSWFGRPANDPQRIVVPPAGARIL